MEARRGLPMPAVPERTPQSLGAICATCPLAGVRNPGSWAVLGIRTRSQLVIVGDVPGEVDEHAKKPFQGEPGFVIQENLKRLGIPKEEVGYTYAIACRPRSEPSAKEWSRAVVCCRPRLAAELGVLAADRAAVPGDAAVPSVPVPGLPDDASGSRRAGAVCAAVG